MSLQTSTKICRLIKKKDDYWEWRLTHKYDTMSLSVRTKSGGVFILPVRQKQRSVWVRACKPRVKCFIETDIKHLAVGDVDCLKCQVWLCTGKISWSRLEVVLIGDVESCVSHVLAGHSSRVALMAVQCKSRSHEFSENVGAIAKF